MKENIAYTIRHLLCMTIYRKNHVKGNSLGFHKWLYGDKVKLSFHDGDYHVVQNIDTDNQTMTISGYDKTYKIYRVIDIIDCTK